jgi:antitoxin (DNA-binding transcriptional repressor) of toxin-antitoxin stability system
LSELVERAAGGEEVVITVRGRPKARLCPMAPAASGGAGVSWGRALAAARTRWSAKVCDSGAAVLDTLRGDRL